MGSWNYIFVGQSAGNGRRLKCHAISRTPVDQDNRDYTFKSNVILLKIHLNGKVKYSRHITPLEYTQKWTTRSCCSFPGSWDSAGRPRSLSRCRGSMRYSMKHRLTLSSDHFRKTKELLRLLELKGTSLTQIGDYARCVICLDLSTSLFGHEFDSVSHQSCLSVHKCIIPLLYIAANGPKTVRVQEAQLPEQSTHHREAPGSLKAHGSVGDLYPTRLDGDPDDQPDYPRSVRQLQ